jgi:flagellar biosynthesis chaperone FliJ
VAAGKKRAPRTAVPPHGAPNAVEGVEADLLELPVPLASSGLAASALALARSIDDSTTSATARAACARALVVTMRELRALGSVMARASRKRDPLQRLEEIRQRRIALAHQRDDWARKRTEAERALAELPDRRRTVMQAQARGEDAELPTGEGLQAIIAEAIERDAAIRVEEQRLTGDEHAVIDGSLRFFEELAEKGSREAEQELDRAVESAQAAQRAIRAAVDAWHDHPGG